MLRKIVVANDGFEMQASIVDDDMTVVSLVEYAKDEKRSTESHDFYESVSTTEVYLSPEELRECVDGLMYILERIELEGGAIN